MNTSFTSNYCLYRKMHKRTNWQLEVLSNLQLEKINRIFQNISLRKEYYSYFDGLYNNVKEIKHLDEMKKIPVITRKQLKMFINNFKKNNLSKKLISLTSSGSTGSRNQIFLSVKENYMRAASFFRMLRFNGYNWNELIFSLLNPEYIRLKKKRWYHYFGLVRELAVDYSIDISEQVKLFLKTNPTVLRGRMGAVYSLAQELKKCGLHKNIKLVFTTGEQLLKSYREFMEEIFGCTVIDYYGATEYGVIAWECPQHNGYHIDMDNVFLELIIDSQLNKYKVIVTNLNAFHFPIIRYELNDFSSGIIEQPFCGCSFPLLQDIEGHKYYREH